MQVRNDTFYHFKTKWIAKGQQWISKPKVPTEMCILYKVHTPLWLSSENNLCDRPPKGVYHCFMLTWRLNYTRSSHGAMTLEIDIEYSPFSALFIYEVESRTLSIPLVNCEACAHSWNVFHFTLKLQNKFFFSYRYSQKSYHPGLGHTWSAVSLKKIVLLILLIFLSTIFIWICNYCSSKWPIVMKICIIFNAYAYTVAFKSICN